MTKFVDLLNQPEEAHELSTEDCIVALPRSDCCSLSSRLQFLRIEPMSFRCSGFSFSNTRKQEETCFLSRNPSTSTGGRFSMVLRFLVCLRKLCVLLLVVNDGVLLCFFGSALMLSPLLKNQIRNDKIKMVLTNNYVHLIETHLAKPFGSSTPVGDTLPLGPSFVPFV